MTNSTSNHAWSAGARRQSNAERTTSPGAETQKSSRLGRASGTSCTGMRLMGTDKPASTHCPGALDIGSGTVTSKEAAVRQASKVDRCSWRPSARPGRCLHGSCANVGNRSMFQPP